jgi:large subunit ribosomal protein L6
MSALRRSIRMREGVEVVVRDGSVSVRGPLGTIVKDFVHTGVSITKGEGEIVVATQAGGRKANSILGTVAKHVENMMLGTTRGFQCKLNVVYSHFPITLKVDGDRILIRNFIGERSPRKAKVEGRGVKVVIDADNVTLNGVNIEEVMQTAANLETATRIIGKDQRIFLDGVYVVEKGFQHE